MLASSDGAVVIKKYLINHTVRIQLNNITLNFTVELNFIKHITALNKFWFNFSKKPPYADPSTALETFL